MVGELITMVKGSIDGLQEQWLGSKVMPTPTPAVARLQLVKWSQYRIRGAYHTSLSQFFSCSISLQLE